MHKNAFPECTRILTREDAKEAHNAYMYKRIHIQKIQVKCIPGVSVERAKEITEEAHNTGMSIVGIWMFELAEAYSDVLQSAGLHSDIEEE